MEDWALIRSLSKSERLSQRAIAKRLGVDRGTVKRALAADVKPTYSKAMPTSSRWALVEPLVRGLLGEFPAMPAAVIAERVGWQRDSSHFRHKVGLLRPEYQRVDPVDRLTHLPGEQTQCDLWFPGVDIPLPGGSIGRFPVLVMVAAFARFIAAVMLPSRMTADLLAGMWLLIERDFQAVPRVLLWDNEAGIGRQGRLTQGVSGWCGTLGTRIVQAKPYDPETKGVVERANGFLGKSFLPGRSFTGPEDFNNQIGIWLAEHGNTRLVRATGVKPSEAIIQDRAAMGDLPPFAPNVSTTTIRLGRSYYVRVGANDYSVDPIAIDRLVTVSHDLNEVQVYIGERLMAHHKRSWGRGTTITDHDHVSGAKILRLAYQQPKTPVVSDDLIRNLGDYDTAFGLDPAEMVPPHLRLLEAA